MQPALLKLFRAMPNTGIPVQQCAFHLFEDISDVKKKKSVLQRSADDRVHQTAVLKGSN